jgi:hypothetical protein
MSEAAEKIVAAMTSNQAPPSGWTMPDLRKFTGLSVGNFAAGVAHLRREGRMAVFDLALVPAADDAAPVPSVADEVAAEAQERVASRAAARRTGPSSPARVSIGADLQERALNDAPAFAASILKDRWGPVWDRVCRHAYATNQRPIPAMIALLNRGLEREAQA